jgi:hypothetical protein
MIDCLISASVFAVFCVCPEAIPSAKIRTENRISRLIVAILYRKNQFPEIRPGDVGKHLALEISE